MGVCSRVLAISMMVRVSLFLTLASAVGCQMPQPGLGNRFVAHVAMVDSSGLQPAITLADLNVKAGLPHGWETMETQSSSMYTHQQWRSSNHATGVGVAYIHMPLPMTAKALVWLAKTRYSRQNAKDHKPDPHVGSEWTDSLGREWLDGANEKYHVRAYVFTSGFDAWVVYAGYRLKSPPKDADISLAFRSMDSIVPLPLDKQSTAITSAVGGR